MIDELNANNLLSPLSVLSSTVSDFGNLIPEDGRTVVIFDENVFGLAVANGINEIFPDYDLVKVNLVTFAGATDTQISNTLSQKNWRTIFITADSGDSFPIPSDQFSIVRFSNNNTSTATQLFLLWSLTQTKGFRGFENWFNKDIRIGTQSVYFISDGLRSEPRMLSKPHPNSTDSKRWESPPKIPSVQARAW